MGSNCSCKDRREEDADSISEPDSDNDHVEKNPASTAMVVRKPPTSSAVLSIGSGGAVKSDRPNMLPVHPRTMSGEEKVLTADSSDTTSYVSTPIATPPPELTGLAEAPAITLPPPASDSYVAPPPAEEETETPPVMTPPAQSGPVPLPAAPAPTKAPAASAAEAKPEIKGQKPPSPPPAASELQVVLDRRRAAVDAACESQEESPEPKAATPKAAPEPAKAGEPRAKMWKVIGGEDTGGIVVRKAADLKSEALARLAFGAVIEEIRRTDAGRIEYKRVSGAGPITGWVSSTVKGKPILSPA